MWNREEKVLEKFYFRSREMPHVVEFGSLFFLICFVVVMKRKGSFT